MRRGWLVVLFMVAACGGKKKPPPGTKDGGAIASVTDGGAGPKVIARPADRIVDPRLFDKARIEGIEKLGFQDLLTVPRLCLRPPAVTLASIDIHKSLFVHDRATIDAGNFSLMRTLKQLTDQAVLAGADPAQVTPEHLFRDLWDTQNASTTPPATAAGAHCDDNSTTLNGFPNDCRPIEGAQATAPLTAEIGMYRPIALVNRLDLAAEGWRNCGEHRIVYARTDGSRNFIIFEAVLPNPRPGCQSGCRAVATHWHSMSAMTPANRASALEKLFYDGLPGFDPVVHVDHYAATGATGGYGSSGSGQIRTNMFMERVWMLKEFKLALDCSLLPDEKCALDAVPLPVAVNPHGELWAETTAGLANDFQQNVAVPAVTAAELGGPPGTFSYQVPGVFNGARSDAQSGKRDDEYLQVYTGTPGAGGFRAQMVAAGAGLPTPLTETQLVNRALALSCAGCHQPAGFGLTAPDAIGPGQSFPNSLSFVHTDESGTLSPALLNEFLPARQQNLLALLNARVCLCRPKRVPFDLTPFQDRLARRTIGKLEDLRTAEEVLTREVNVELRRTQQPELPPLTVSRTATPLVLDEVKKAGPDPRARALARRAAVQKLVADEPPRKTVTGHFRTH